MEYGTVKSSEKHGIRKRGQIRRRVGRLKVVGAMVLLPFSVCSADVVQGTVTDATSGLALAQALVQEAGTGSVTLTDAQGKFTLDINATSVRPRDGKAPNDPAPKLAAGALVIRKGGYASRWASFVIGDTDLAVPLARELETAGPSAGLFANPYYVCLRNFYVAPPPAGNDAHDGTSPQSPWATLTKANIGRVAGDCVHLAPGTYHLTGEVTITSGGNAATPAGYVVYRSTKMGAARLVAAVKFNHMMRITTHYVMFDGIDFDGNNFSAGLCGLDVEQSTNYHHIWVMNSQVHGFGQSGIQENRACMPARTPTATASSTIRFGRTPARRCAWATSSTTMAARASTFSRAAM
jgi:hypothetical protein